MRRALASTLTALLAVGALAPAATAAQTFPGENGKIVFVRRGASGS